GRPASRRCQAGLCRGTLWRGVWHEGWRRKLAGNAAAAGRAAHLRTGLWLVASGARVEMSNSGHDADLMRCPLMTQSDNGYPPVRQVRRITRRTVISAIPLQNSFVLPFNSVAFIEGTFSPELVRSANRRRRTDSLYRP